tara:strand:+ start:11942 stop:12298 length:357 start_codon:yes stop_codon:yes gene_type:complete
MSIRKSSIIAAGLLASTLLATSPVLMAADHDGHNQHSDSQRDMTEMCDNMHEGKGRFNKAERQEEMAERQEAMAERLKLNNEQRGIWNEIHEEKREQHDKRMKKMQEKMKERCDQPKK